MKHKLIPISVILLFTSVLCQSQQQVMFTQYMFNGLAINPAYAGTHNNLSMTALGRYQWTGLKGAPNTHTFSAHTPLKHDKIGLGLLFVSDQIGITDQNSIYFSYAYRLPLSEDGEYTLSMGLQGGLSNFSVKFSDSHVHEVNDLVFSQGDVNELFPNFGVGFFLTAPKFYVGLSIPQLMNNDIEFTQVTKGITQRHYFLQGGYVFSLNKSLKLRPGFLIKGIAGSPIQLDINANLLIEEVLWVGLSYRSFDSVDGLLQFQLTDHLRVGYAYDFATSNQIRSINGGSHEIMINYQLVFKNRRVITPRYY